jgi:hypothetical protein
MAMIILTPNQLATVFHALREASLYFIAEEMGCEDCDAAERAWRGPRDPEACPVHLVNSAWSDRFTELGETLDARYVTH